MSGALVYVASWALTLSGYLFDWVLTKTVLQFGSFVNQNVIQGINVAWTVGRDLSSIIIIALFTFIAISTILGNVEYGVRRMLSRVLIIAVLINFSLLFTKIIIDISNFTATQLYVAASTVIPVSNTAATATVASVSGSAPQSGVSGAFMQYAGVSSFGDTYKAVNALAQQQNSWIALLFGIFVSLLFIVAAVVLLYGTFLLVTRALVLVFLMITAALAFASYLWPKLSEGGYGWNAWWNALLKNAVFAPMLMFFLWVSLKLGATFATTTGSLGQLLIDPKSTINVDALLGYILVIGLLFASLKLSSSFASSVGGLNLGQYAFDLGRSRLGGLTWQQTVGRFAYNRERAAMTNARVGSAEAERIRRRAETVGAMTDFDKKSLKELDEKVAKNTRRANTFGSLANKQVGGVQGFAGGIGKPPSAAREVRKAQDRAANTEKQAAPTQTPQQSQQSPQLEETLKQQRDINASIESGEKERAELERQRGEQFKKLVDSSKEATEAQKTIASDTSDRKQIEDKVAGDLKKQLETIAPNMDPSKRAEIEQDLRRQSDGQRASELRHQNDKIEHATQQIRQITESDPMLSELQKRLEAVDEKLGVNRATAKEIGGKVLALQNNAPTPEAPAAEMDASSVSSHANTNEEVFSASRGRTLRAEVFRPQSTDVATYTDVTIHDRPIPIQNQQKAA